MVIVGGDLTSSPIKYNTKQSILFCLSRNEREMSSTMSVNRNIDNLMNQLEETFSQRLLRMIDERGMTDSEAYTKAYVDRRHFSKIRKDVNYVPNKKTVLAFTIGVAGDSYKIIIATENIIGSYKELLKQKLSFEKVDAGEPYRALIEQMYSCIREMCDGFTELYNKMLIAKDKIKACIMGELDNKSVTVDLGLTMNADMDSLMETLKNVKRTEELINDR